MESPVNATVEQIKLQEHIQDTILKEKRAYEATVSSLRRNIRGALAMAAKLKQENLNATSTLETVASKLQLEKVRRSALSGLVDDAQKELQIYQDQSMHGISDVWKSRSLLSETVHKVADQCDVWALFKKPKTIQIPIAKKVNEVTELSNESEERLNNVKTKYKRIQAERDRLQIEPDTGEEFLRRCRLFCTKVEESGNGPIKFTTSAAAKKTTIPVMRKANIEMPWYQPYSVVGSVAVFLIYFCYLREENDVDVEFTKTLYDRIHGLEKEQLLQSYRYNIDNGMSVTDIERRLEEIEEEERKAM